MNRSEYLIYCLSLYIFDIFFHIIITWHIISWHIISWIIYESVKALDIKISILLVVSKKPRKCNFNFKCYSNWKDFKFSSILNCEMFHIDISFFKRNYTHFSKAHKFFSFYRLTSNIDLFFITVLISYLEQLSCLFIWSYCCALSQR